MAITSSDILLKLATTAGSAGDSTSQGDPNASLGKYMSTTQMSTSLHGLFDKITGTENAADDVEYRCVFVHNNHATLTAEAVTVYLSSEVGGGASTAIAIDSTAASAKGSSSAQALTIANENTAPAAISFSSPTTDGTGLSLGDIPAGSCRAFWVRRTAAHTGAVDADGVTFGIAFDTAA